jgi:predicted transcriptional regulator
MLSYSPFNDLFKTVMLKAEPDARCNIKILHKYSIVLIIVILYCPLIISAQNCDSLSEQSIDSVKSFIWQPKILPELNQFDPYNVSQTLQHIVSKSKKSIKYYDPNNVMPKNFWEMDYRGTSYYTPRIVSDRLAQMMDRLPPDSFMPLPTIAFLAASIALKYTDIQLKIEIKATDYLIDEDLECILVSLLENSPQTAKDIYQSREINKSRTMEVLEKDLQTLIDKKIVKKRKMETEPEKYYAAQDIETIIKLIEHDLSIKTFTNEQIQKLTKLTRKLSSLQENSE